jgi:CubicO group peptidase (beta-lactamase class C family)
MRTGPSGLIVRLFLAVAGCLVLSPGTGAQQNNLSGLIPFESYLESLRVQAGIPGMSAIMLQDGEVVWERGLGFQNQESRIRATPDTPYPIADLNQTLTATLVLHCTEQRRLDLGDPIRRYGESVAEPGATIRQLLSHTSAGAGDTFQYDPERFAKLTRSVEACIEQPFRKTVAVELLERLAMKDSVPGRDVVTPGAFNEPLFSVEILERYRRVLDRLAVPYKVDKRGRLTRSELQQEGINAASGLVSTVRDLARFDAALGKGLLLRDETRAMAWSNMQTSQSTAIPTGLGWFVQTYRNDRVVWHFGLVPNAYSSLIIKLPGRGLTFILLANSDGLSAPFQLDAGDITRSIFATLFLRLYT